MKNYIYSLLLVGFGLVSCNQSKTTPKSDAVTTAIPETKIIKAKKGDTVNAQPGDKIYMESTITVQNTHDLPNSFFNRKWMRSPSEDKDYEGEVYRPEGHTNLTPMRFTPTFTFMKDKSCEYLKQMSNDAHEMEGASWAYNISKQLRIFKSVNTEREMLYDWKIKETKEDLLVVEAGSSGSR